MFKKFHSFTVLGNKLEGVLTILGTYGVMAERITIVIPERTYRRYHISVRVNRKQWDEIKNAIYANSQIGGACSDFN